jgi:hypothetical protein
VTTIVLAPASLSIDGLPGAIEVRRYRDVEDVVAALESAGSCILLSDGLAPENHPRVAAAIRAAGATVIEVQSLRWDGETHSELTAACRGVIAGFGAGAGINRALEAV